MRCALVTGASRGIGRATAIALSERGVQVAVHYAQNESAGEETLRLLHGQGHVLVSGDLSVPDTAQAVVEQAEAQLGQIDLLVNNAGIAPGKTTEHRVDETDYATWQQRFTRMIDVDLTAPANMSYLVARSLITRGAPGTIVNVGSRGAFRGEPDAPGYGAAKAGLHALGQSLALSLAPHGISVATVAPGFIATDMLRQTAERLGITFEQFLDAAAKEIPVGRVGQPEDIANAVAFFCSEAASFVNGQVLYVAGGPKS